MRALTILLLTLTACAPMESSVGTTDAGVDCSTCTGDTYCEVSVCGSTFGQCVQKPIGSCDDTFSPVCDCYGVTYLNRCRLQQAGQTVAVNSQCPHGVSCDPAHACTGGAICGQINPDNQCSMGHGRCWNVPASCPSAPGRFLSCTTGTCMDLCQAMHSGEVFTQNATGTCQ